MIGKCVQPYRQFRKPIFFDLNKWISVLLHRQLRKSAYKAEAADMDTHSKDV